MTIAMFHYCSYITVLLQPFLKILSIQLYLRNKKTAKELVEIKLDDQKKLLKTKDVCTGFAATNEIQKKLQKDSL